MGMTSIARPFKTGTFQVDEGDTTEEMLLLAVLIPNDSNINFREEMDSPK
jgi:hypothetical protein